MNFTNVQDGNLLEQPVTVKRQPIGAKSLVIHTRRDREGLRAFSPGAPAPQQAASRLDERLVRLLMEISTCSVDAAFTDVTKGEPRGVSRAVASKVAQDLYLAHHMRPIRVAASLEGGIMLVYRDHPKLEMEIEVDNEGDVTGVISTDETVLMSAMITLPAEFSRLVTAYRLSTTTGMRRPK